MSIGDSLSGDVAPMRVAAHVWVVTALDAVGQTYILGVYWSLHAATAAHPPFGYPPGVVGCYIPSSVKDRWECEGAKPMWVTRWEVR